VATAGSPARSAPGFRGFGLFRSRRKPLTLPLTTSHDGKGNQERHDANGTNDVRHHGKRTGDITRVRPDDADNHSHHKESDHSNEPVEDSSFGDATDARPVRAFRQPFRQTLLGICTRTFRSALCFFAVQTIRCGLSIEGKSPP
jgi:hypothetical protein